MDCLDDFLMQQIFVRLPVKSANRSKCVSKHWLSLMSETYFVREYVQFQSRLTNDDVYKNLYRTTIIYTERLSGIPHCLDRPVFPFEYERFSFEFIPRKLQMFRLNLLAASHGWIFCSTESQMSDFPGNEWMHDYYHLCNPVFKQWIDIPRYPKPKYEYEYSLAGFVCEIDFIRSSDRNNVFAEKPVLQFKIVKVINDLQDHILRVIIFSSQSWEWNTLKITKPSCSPGTNMLVRKPGIVSCHETLYWMTEPYRCVFALNLKTEGDGNPLHLQCIPLPNYVGKNCAQLGLCKDQILLSRWSLVTDRRNFLSIWQLIKEGHRNPRYQWSLKHKVSICACIEMVHCAPSNEEMVCLVMSMRKVFLINLKKHTVVERINCDNMFWNSAVPYPVPYWPLPLQRRSRREMKWQY